MKIHLASDLHLEFLQQPFPGERLIMPAEGADVLVLAGDIANGTQAIDLFQDWPVPVLYVAGNHEYYDQSFDQLRHDLRQAAHGTAIRFMENDVVDVGGVRFLGATLWTDYRLHGDHAQRRVMAGAQRSLNDHHVIRTQEGYFTTARALQEHEQSRQWLASQLAKPYGGKTVVVTHHGPHPLSVHPRYVGEDLNAAFVSDLSALLPHADVWLHGHVHDNFDYVAHGCRVVANPRGYARNRYAVDHPRDLIFENTAFQYAYVIDTDEAPAKLEI